jgi:hypothetical protein
MKEITKMQKECISPPMSQILQLIFIEKQNSTIIWLEHGVLRFRKISWNNLISLVPFISSDIHLKCFNKFTSINIIFFSKIKLSHFRVMLSYLFIIGSWNFRRLIGNKLNGSIPFSCIQSSFNSLIKNTSLNIVLNW